MARFIPRKVSDSSVLDLPPTRPVLWKNTIHADNHLEIKSKGRCA